MDRTEASGIVEGLHGALAVCYAGGSVDSVCEHLTDDVTWHVPGDNAIAGDYEGVEGVLGYFARRRDLVGGSLRLHPGEVLVGDTHVAVLTDGTALVAGVERRWSTVGIYRIEDGRVAECWLLPLDPAAFDEIWSAVP